MFNPNSLCAPSFVTPNSPNPSLAIITPEMYGAKGDNTTDDYTAFNNAITALKNNGGGVLQLGAKSYKLNTALNVTSPITIKGVALGKSVLNAGANSQTIILLSASNCCFSDFTVADGHGVGNVVGIKLGGLGDSTNIIANQNMFLNIGYSGTLYGRVMQINGTGGECYENTFIGEQFVNVGEAIQHANPSVAGNGGPNGNNTIGFAIFSAGTTSNSGIYIAAGASNNFAFGYIEGMSNSGPQTNPVAIKIDHASSDGFNNDSNKFFGVSGESNTYTIINANALSEFYACDLGTGLQTWTANPGVCISAQPSQFPVVIPGYVFQSNGQLTGFNNGGTLQGYSGQQVFNVGGAGPEWIPQVATTGPGGGTATISFAQSYVANAIYQVWAGGSDQAGTQVSGAFRGTFIEGPSGTFTQLDATSGGYSVTAGTPSAFSVTLSRSSNNIVVSIDITKTSITFLTYAHLFNYFLGQ